jgi:methylenetetrahydrofolate reductase (NADPH)
VLFRRRRSLSDPQSAALARLLVAPTFELIPLKSSMDQAALLPAGATVSVTASPAKGIETTVALCEQLQAHGFRAVPHISARMIRDRAHLADLIEWMEGAGVDRAFVVGGDAKEPGAFPDGLSLLREMAEIGHPLSEIGIPGYPQGHAFIADGPLLEALRAKAPFASYITTQLCFDPAAIASWIAARRAEGITQPVHVGIPGVAEPQKLLTIAARIGVADTHRFLVKNVRFVTRLIRSGGFYRPDGLLEGLAAAASDPAMGISGLHIYTFNAVEGTEGWRHSTLAKLAPHEADRTLVAGRSVTTRAELLEAFASFPDRLRVAAQGAGGRPPPPGEWGPTEVIRHLIAVEVEVHAYRLRRIAIEDDARWQWTEPGLAAGFERAQLPEVLEAFETKRASTVRVVRALNDDGWARHGTHARYGSLDVEGLLRLASDHDAEHLTSLTG